MSDKLLEQLHLKKSTKEPVEEFLKSIGYKSSSCPITKEFMAKPDFYAKRDENIIAVFVIMDPKKIDAELSRVKTVSFQLGRNVDYVLLLPAFDENKLIELVCAAEDKAYKKLVKDKFMVWMWDAAKKKPAIFFNAPLDKTLLQQCDDKGDIVAKSKGK